MKMLATASAWIALGALTAIGLGAQVESLKIEPTFVPPLSPAMLADGITSGQLVVVINVSAEGQLTDSLILGYTHPSLVRPFTEALRDWTFTPARLHGEAVPVQVQLNVNYTATGVVISRNAILDLDNYMQRKFGDRWVERVCTARELDRMPAVLTKVSPIYPKGADEQGVRGKVGVHFYIDQSGAVRMPAVDADAHPYLAELAVTALRNWRFVPPTADGKPVLIAARQEFAFGR